MPVERVQQVIDRITSERERFVEFIRGVPEDQWRNTSPEGIWQARDYVAHLSSIDPLITAWFRSLQRGEGWPEYGGDGPFQIDDWNEEQILARREHTIDALLEEMARSRDELIAALGDFTDEQIDRTIHFGGDRKRAPREIPLHAYLQFWAFHDRWHTEDARRAIAGETEQPFGDAAFARSAQGELAGS
ncbi:MAG: DinB family protein [Dehalococcoidia bacterium]